MSIPTRPTLSLEYHLENVIWDDATPGERMNASEVARRVAEASPEQVARAQVALDKHIERMCEK